MDALRCVFANMSVLKGTDTAPHPSMENLLSPE